MKKSARESVLNEILHVNNNSISSGRSLYKLKNNCNDEKWDEFFLFLIVAFYYLYCIVKCCLCIELIFMLHKCKPIFHSFFTCNHFKRRRCFTLIHLCKLTYIPDLFENWKLHLELNILQFFQKKNFSLT